MKSSSSSTKKPRNAAQAPPAREWDVNGTATGGRHLGRFPGATGAEAVSAALESDAEKPPLCPACTSRAEELAVDRTTITAHEVGGAGEVYRTGAPSTETPAFVLLSHIWRHRQAATGHSWIRVNQSMHSALMLAITAGLYFDKSDVRRMYDSMRGGYWFGEASGEDFYAAAVASNNESACKSIEAWLNRAPFVYDGRRLTLGSTIQWGELVNASVTSFARDGQSITVCTYKDDDEGRRSARIARRLTIHHDEIRKAESERVATVKETNAVERLVKDLKRAGVVQAVATVRTWDAKQRAAARAWLTRPSSERETPAPAHVLPLPTSATPKARSRRAA